MLNRFQQQLHSADQDLGALPDEPLEKRRWTGLGDGLGLGEGRNRGSGSSLSSPHGSSSPVLLRLLVSTSRVFQQFPGPQFLACWHVHLGSTHARCTRYTAPGILQEKGGLACLSIATHALAAHAFPLPCLPHSPATSRSRVAFWRLCAAARALS